MAKWTKYFKVVQPKPETVAMQDSQDMTGGSLYSQSSWYKRIITGSATRLKRYRDYDSMDNDVEVARALDTIAEEMTGNNLRTDMPLELDMLVEDDKMEETVTLTLRAALQHWCTQHDWENRLFKVARNLIKYGDVFFKKPNAHKKWNFMHPKHIVAAIVDKDDATKVVGYQIRTDEKKPRPGEFSMVSTTTETETEIVEGNEFVRFSLNDDMSDTAPFGESILQSVYRAHKQKELLEDAIIIYRVTRAPERRVFYIDVGKMPPNRVKQYLEQIKNEIRQKKIPSNNGDKSSVESVYNPQSMQEDFFFAQRADGRGSRVDTLPGGQGLGELSDLEYFMDKVFRGLRLPASYMKRGAENAQFNDGRVGQAYIEELRFAMFVMRLQGYLESVLDEEFKKYLHATNINIDETLFRIRLPEPTNFGMYRQQEMDAALLNSIGSADGVAYISKRFALNRYLQLDDDDVMMNERMLREEKGLSENDPDLMKKLYGNPDEMGMEAGGMGGLGTDMTAGGGLGGDELGGEMGAEAPAGEAGAEAGGEGTPTI